MKRQSGIVCLAVSVALSVHIVACGAGNDANPASEPSVDSLVSRHIEARGGQQRLEAITTLSMSGRATTGPGQEASVSREVRPPGRIRTEFTFQGVTSIYACDGAVCWYVNPMLGVFDAELMSPAETALAMEEADVLSAIDWQAKGHQIELLGTETIDGREVYKSRVDVSGGPSRTVYLDAETALVVRRETPRTRGDRTVEVRIDYGDFREVDGLVFPHSIRTRAKDTLEYLEVIVERIEINAPIDDSRFEMPGQ